MVQWDLSFHPKAQHISPPTYAHKIYFVHLVLVLSVKNWVHFSPDFRCSKYIYLRTLLFNVRIDIPRKLCRSNIYAVSSGSNSWIGNPCATSVLFQIYSSQTLNINRVFHNRGIYKKYSTEREY